MIETMLSQLAVEVDGRDLYPSAEEVGGDVLVILGTAACGACRRVRRLLDEVGLEAAGGAPLTVMHVDASLAMGVVEEWEVFHLPALLLLRAGEPWAKVHTRLDADAMAGAIQAARAGAADPEL